MTQSDIQLGSRIPSVKLGWLDGGVVQSADAYGLFAKGRSAIIGVPGAFTPVCTQQHIPDFIRSAATLRASGFEQLVCIAPNDPFVLDQWAFSVDPERQLRFLSDGNLDFAKALGLQANNRELFMSGRTQRYLLTVDKGVISRIRVEKDITMYCCTRAQDVVALD